MGRAKRKPVDQQDEPQETGEAKAEDVAAEAEVVVEDPTAALERERDALTEENLRLIAEGRNQAARFSRERQDALKYANGDFARDLLVILDDIERTQKSALAATDVKLVADGVRIVHEHFLKVFEERGIKPIDAVGREFDPSFHQALLKQASDEHAEGVVIEEAARGYKMHDRVLRPSRVVVSSGPAKCDDPEPADAADSEARESD